MKQEDKAQHDLTVHRQKPMPWADPTVWAAEEGAILPLCPSQVRAHLQCCLQLWASQNQNNVELLE